MENINNLEWECNKERNEIIKFKINGTEIKDVRDCEFHIGTDGELIAKVEICVGK
jgi:hypothetical protein